MKKRQNRGRIGQLVIAAVFFVGLMAIAWTGPATAKVKNPLAGSYRGTTEEGLPMSFRVSRSGQVLGFTAQMKLFCPQPTDPTEITLSVGVPIHLRKPVPGYPKGKRFDYGGTSANPPADILSISGKVATGFRGMEGNVLLRRVHVPSGDLCGTVFASWDARKVG